MFDVHQKLLGCGLNLFLKFIRRFGVSFYCVVIMTVGGRSENDIETFSNQKQSYLPQQHLCDCSC